MSSLFDIQPPPQTMQEVKARWTSCTKCFFGGQYGKPCTPKENKSATILVLGQWPGQQDMENGIPFSGPQGKVCKDFLHGAGFVEAELLYDNVLLCTCPVQPTKDILDNCKSHVDEVISILQPAMIIALGSIAQKRLGVKEIPGRVPEYRGIQVATCPHPAMIARVHSRAEKEALSDEVRSALSRAMRLYRRVDF